MTRAPAPSKEITSIVIRCAFNVMKELGYGFLEKVYENALVLELREQGLLAEQQIPLKVFYRGRAIGDYVADLLIQNSLLIEIKSARAWDPSFEAQLLNYLKASDLELGFIFNFGRSKLQYKRMALTARSTESSLRGRTGADAPVRPCG